MAVEITGSYTGGLGVDLVHGPSGTRLHTAAPVDNQGDGSSFSPTDLMAAALGSCMLTLIGIVADRDGIDVQGAQVRVVKHMVAAPRRIGTLEVRITLPAGIAPAARARLEQAASTCPVHHSLLPDIAIPVEFIYPDTPASNPG